MIEFLITIFLFQLLVYLSQLFLLKKVLTDKSDIENTLDNGISVIIAARDEEQNIKTVIKYLDKQRYPKDLFEVIIVDDNSTDSTFFLATNEISGLNNFYAYRNEEKNILGKRAALQYGISKAKFDFILITDADCKPQEDWISAFSKKFSSRYDFLIGIAPFIKNNGIVNFLSRFENLKNNLLSFYLIKLGFPYTAAARSFGFSKSKFYQLNGYKNTTDTLSGDDDLLLREAVKNNLTVSCVVENNSLVFSETKRTFKEYFFQRSRHTQSSHVYLLTHKIILSIWHLLNIFADISLWLSFVNPVFIIFFVTKIIFALINKILFEIKFGYKFSYMEFFMGELIYSYLTIIHFINSLLLKPKWK
jgi:cellulose synthase/poly-beta-1,6-N-acetylglucosamine synthase-like glycosyltransferase